MKNLQALHYFGVLSSPMNGRQQVRALVVIYYCFYTLIRLWIKITWTITHMDEVNPLHVG